MPIVIYLITVNVLMFLLMLSDKKKAVKNRWRIPESVLLGTAAVGGSLGGLIGMYLFRHKIRSNRFRTGLPLLLALHLSILFFRFVLTFYS